MTAPAASSKVVYVSLGQDGLPVYQPQSTDPRIDAVLRQIYDNVKVEVLGGNVDASRIQAAIDEARPKVEQLFTLSDRLEGASTPAAQRSALSNLVQFIESNGGNKMALFPYLAQKGFDDSVLTGAGIDPAQVRQVADQQARNTPASQADLNRLSASNSEQVAQLQAVIASLVAQIQSLLEQQARLNAQYAAQQDGMASGPNTRPTAGLAPELGATAPTGTVSLQSLALQANIPIRG